MDGGRDVSRAVLLDLLGDAHRAPTHGLTQPWRFRVFTGAGRARLGAGLQELYDRLTPAEQRKADKRAKLGATPLLAPAVIAVAARVDPAGKIPEIEEIAATACAVQNLLLSAHEKQLGGYWSTPPVAMSGEFAAWLGLDGSHRMLGLVYVGYPLEGKTCSLSPRNPLVEHVVFRTE